VTASRLSALFVVSAALTRAAMPLEVAARWPWWFFWLLTVAMMNAIHYLTKRGGE
jgi:hypothetical protein